MKYRKLLWVILWYTHVLTPLDIAKMFEGMAESFWSPSTAYAYNFQVWNSAHVHSYVELESLTSFMGGFVQSAKAFYRQRQLLSLIQSDGRPSFEDFSELYYFTLYISDAEHAHKHPRYKQYFTQLPLKKYDSKIYYYHTYTARNFDKGKVVYDIGVELLGFQDPKATDDKLKGSIVISSQLSNLNFVNSSEYDVLVSLTYNSKPYTFTLEKYSYASLGLPTPQEKKQKSTTDAVEDIQLDISSDNARAVDAKKQSAQSEKQQATQPEVKIQSTDEQPVASKPSADQSPSKTDIQKPPFSLRPNVITLAKYNEVEKKYENFGPVKLSEKGFDGYPYTLEILEDENKKMTAGMQGLTPGHYDLAVTSRIRDVTPCPCFFWYQSVNQVKNSVQNGYSNLPGQVWLVYTGKDNPVQVKVTAGTAITWDLTRPLIAQQDQYVYVLYIATTDDAKAIQFIEKFKQKLVGAAVINEYESFVQQPFDPATITQEILNIQDGVQDVQKTELSAEQQVATLMGQFNTTASVLYDEELDLVGYILGADVFTSKGIGFGRFYYVLPPSVLSFTSLASLLLLCINQDTQDVQAVTTLVQGWYVDSLKDTKLVAKKVEQYFIEHGKSSISTGKQLTPFGAACLKKFLTGSVSLRYPALKLSTVNNQFVYDFGRYEQEGWPTLISIDLQASKKSDQNKV